jgi:DNA polymerase I-like protein with 3'-5' exonuclease and polymerase domains
MAIYHGLAPPGATKKTHKRERAIVKVLVLAMMYGGGPGMIANKLRTTRGEAVELLRRQREAFPVFFTWSDNYANLGRCVARLYSPLGWRLWPRYWKDGESPDRTCRNFPVQAAGADIMRIAAIMLFREGIAINAIVHDAFVVEATSENIERVAARAREIMMEATELVIGKAIPVSLDITKSGERFFDEEGQEDFELLKGLLEGAQHARKAA